MKRNLIIVILIVAVLLLSGLGVGLYFLLRSDETPDTIGAGAVVTSAEECTEAAVKILQMGGSAVDSAITAVLCQGLVVPQSSGLGGGFLATVYIKEAGTIETLNAREVAPLAGSKDMFPDDLSSREGGLAIAVPTELKGLHELHKKYGKLAWAEVVEPVIEIAESGFKVGHYLSTVFEERGDKIRDAPGYGEYFVDSNTGDFYKEGDILKNPKLASTLKTIAKEGADAFYDGGSMTKTLVDEIRNAGGIITTEDFTSYEPKWGKPSITELFNGDSFYTFPLPSTGPVIKFIMNILKGYKFEERSFEAHNEDKLIYHRIMEAFKYGFAKRTKLGDESTAEVLETLAELESSEYADLIRSLITDDKTFNDYEHYGANTTLPEDHGTSHISIIAPNGDAVALTTTINFIMGSYVMSNSTGIIFNNEMNDFSIPAAPSDGLLPAPGNFIAPKKSPMSSMAPIIVVNEDKEVSVVLGGAGGILIMTSVIQFIIYYLHLKRSIDDSIAAKRLHHQLEPMRVLYEEGYDSAIISFLESKGHVTFKQAKGVGGFASLNGIGRKNGTFEGAVDPRRGGKFTVF